MENDVILAACLLGIPSLILFRLIVSRNREQRNLINAKALINNHPSGGALYSFENNDSGIFISKDKKAICLYRGRIAKLYDIDKIRGHRTSLIEPDKHFTVGRVSLKAAADTMHANNRAARRAEEQSGIFIQIKDVDFPEWHINMTNKKDQSRWHEILTQLYEGELGDN